MQVAYISFKKQKKNGGSCISFCGGSTRTRCFSNFTALKFISENFVVSQTKETPISIVTRATVLVAHKMVDFARKTNRNLPVWDSLPYPTQSFFTPYPQRVYGRAYADVTTNDCGLLLVGRNEMGQKLNRERKVSLVEPFLASDFLVSSYLESYFVGVKDRRGRGE